MALDYGLRLTTRREPARVLDDARRALDGQAVEVGVAPSTPVGRAVMREALGFEPDVTVVFKVLAREEADAAIRAIVEASLGLLAAEPGDAALVANGETVVFVKRADGLTIHEGHWPSALAEPPGAKRAKFAVI